MRERVAVLDGWRGISILLVLLAHLFPVGPSYLEFNEMCARMGMAIFFCLSGFLITSLLLKDTNIPKFLLKRFARIIPLAWLVTLITLLLYNANLYEYISNLFFFSTAIPMTLFPANSHFWSLCVEMQFYVFIAVMVACLGRKALYIMPFLCILITLNRIYNEVPAAINTYYRIDEVLAGVCLSLLFYSDRNYIPKVKFSWTILLFVGLALSSHPHLVVLNYLRPYICILLVASTLKAESTTLIYKVLTNNILVYIATISFALYIFHGGLRYTWLGSGETLEKYLKRPLLLLVTFVLAHISTFYYENYFQKIAKKITR